MFKGEFDSRTAYFRKSKKSDALNASLFFYLFGKNSIVAPSAMNCVTLWPFSMESIFPLLCNRSENLLPYIPLAENLSVWSWNDLNN